MKPNFIPPKGKISKIKGKCISLIGDDIDTDRIIPARFLRRYSIPWVRLFLMMIEMLKGMHPFDLRDNETASILVVNAILLWFQ